MQNIFSNLEINYKQFIILCICLGCDYNSKIIYDTPIELFNSLKEVNMDIEKFILNNKRYKIPSDFLDTFYDTYKYFSKEKGTIFSNQNNNLNNLDKTLNFSFNFREPNIKKINSNLIDNNSIISNNFKKSIKNKIHILRTHYKLLNKNTEKYNRDQIKYNNNLDKKIIS